MDEETPAEVIEPAPTTVTSRLSRCLTFLLLIVLAFTHEVSLADNVKGRLRFYPPIDGTVTAFLNVYKPGASGLLTVFNVNATSPYEFSGTVDEAEATVEIEAVVESPSGYVPRVRRYKKNQKVGFIEVIPIMRRADAYILLMQQAQTAKDRAVAKEEFDYLATSLAETPVQKIEVFRAHAKWVDSQPEKDVAIKAAEQVRILATAYQSGAVSEVGEKKKKVYWQERLDAFLNLTGYSSLNQPVQDFATKIAEDANYHQAWTAFVRQYEKESKGVMAVPNVATKADLVSEQLKVLRLSLGHAM